MKSSKRLTTIMRSWERFKEAMGRLSCSLNKELFDQEEKGSSSIVIPTLSLLYTILMEGSL